MPQSWFARLCNWPTTPHARFEQGVPCHDHPHDSYAVAAGANLNLSNSAPKRVAMIVEPTPFTHTSGYSTRFKNLLRQMKIAGDNVLVIVPDNHPDAPIEFEGTPIINIPGFRFPLYKLITLTFGLRGLYHALKGFDPDVIHLTTPGLVTFATILYARLLRKPLLFSYHTHLPIYVRNYGFALFEGLMWAMLRLQHNSADFTLTVSPPLCEELISHGFKRVGLWQKAIDVDVFSPEFRSASMRHRLTGGAPDAPLLLCVGRLGAEKNLKLFKALLARLPRARLALVGDGPERETLTRTLSGTNTYFAGIMHGKELSEAFASADVFVTPSESETLGFVALESMASGVPVIAPRAGGLPDIVTHGRVGFLFEPGNVDECAKWVQILLDDRKRRDEMAGAARKEAARWTWEASAASTRNIGYEHAIAHFRARHAGDTALLQGAEQRYYGADLEQGGR